MTPCIQIECRLRARGLFAAIGPLSLRGPLAAKEGDRTFCHPDILRGLSEKKSETNLVTESPDILAAGHSGMGSLRHLT